MCDYEAGLSRVWCDAHCDYCKMDQEWEQIDIKWLGGREEALAGHMPIECLVEERSQFVQPEWRLAS